MKEWTRILLAIATALFLAVINDASGAEFAIFYLLLLLILLSMPRRHGG